MPAQLILDGVVHGTVLAVLALGFVILHMATRFFVFTYGSTFTLSGYALLAAAPHFGIPGAALVAVLTASLAGLLLELFVYRPIRSAGSGPLVQMLASIGAYVVLQNAVSITFGDVTRSARTWPTAPGTSLVFGTRLTTVQMLAAGCSVALVGLTLFGFFFTTFGRNLRAVASDRELAVAVGVDLKRTMICATLLASALSGAAGVLVSIDTDLIPTMGFNALLLAIVAAILGGMTSVVGAVVGGLTLGVFRYLVVWPLPAHWAETLLFVLMIVFLTLRPQGLFGHPLKISNV